MSKSKPCTHHVSVRDEGKFYRAYWTKVGTMEGAEEIASIRRDLCVHDPMLFELFMHQARISAIAMAEMTLGAQVAELTLSQPPVHEIAGHA
ncbi:MAG: hypothetical protein QM749_00405 [Aquabacterium sp.]